METRIDPKACGYVVRKSFRLKDLPRTLWGLSFSKEFRPIILLIALSLALILSGYPTLSLGPLLGALAWVIITSRGKQLGISIRQAGKPIGGMRCKYTLKRFYVMGLYVEPEHRKSGAATKLTLKMLETAREYCPDGELIAYTPTHPASKRLVEKYLLSPKLKINSSAFEMAINRTRQALKD